MACVPSEKARWGKDGGSGGKETALARQPRGFPSPQKKTEKSLFPSAVRPPFPGGSPFPTQARISAPAGLSPATPVISFQLHKENPCLQTATKGNAFF